MKSFLEASVCNGGRPQYVPNESFLMRNALLVALMSDRSRVRYLLAPTAFGKTTLACTYAKMNFEFRDTSWISGRSPCFLRDLDADAIADGIMNFISPSGLVVFDDVPDLNALRAELLWKCVTKLVKSGREVLVCTTPGADPLKRHRDSCVVLEGHSFLLTDEEIESLKTHRLALPTIAPPQHKADRIPGLIGAGEHEQERFLSNVIADASHAQKALLFIMFILAQGKFSEIGALAGKTLTIEPDRCVKEFPYITIDPDTHEFSTKGFSLNAVLRAFQPTLRDISALCDAKDGGHLALRLADALSEKGDFNRAGEVAIRLCPADKRVQWLKRIQWSFMGRGGLLPLEQVFASLSARREYSSVNLTLGSAIRRALLGERSASLATLLRIARSKSTPRHYRISAASWALIFADDTACTLSQIDFARALSDISYATSDTHLLPSAIALWTHIQDDPYPVIAVLDALGSSPHEEDKLALVCALRLTEKLTETCQARVKQAIQTLLDTGQDFTILDALLLQEAKRTGLGDSPIDPAVVLALKHSVAQQRSLYLKKHREQVSQTACIVAFPGATNPSVLAAPKVAPLSVHLFGSFQIYQNGNLLPQERFTSNKAKCLLVALAAAEGREISCARLTGALWPDSPPTRASHNFSNTVSKLKASIALPNGTCPYFDRAQGVIRLNTETVQTDLGELLVLCRRLSKNQIPIPELSDTLEKIRNLYVGDLLPDTVDEALAAQARRLCRKAVVDALMSMIAHLCHAKDLHTALDFAHQALLWDPEREDYYEKLMLLQGCIGQRPAAITTWNLYIKCMRSLGIDPAASMQRLYLRIIEGDDLTDAL